MSKPDWSEAPEGAMWWCPKNLVWYKKANPTIFYWAVARFEWVSSGKRNIRKNWISRPTTEKTMKLILEFEDKKDTDAFETAVNEDRVKYWFEDGSPCIEIEPRTVKKEHPLQCLEGTKILCEFWNDSLHVPSIGFLKEITDRRCFRVKGGPSYQNCTPVKNFWNAWNGGECPVPEGMEARVTLRSGEIVLFKGMTLPWNHTSRDDDIIAVMYLGDS